MNATDRGRCWSEIDLAALRRNAAVALDCVDQRAELMAIVKADGYGHGMTQVAAALQERARLFGVANLAEAITLRGVVSQPISLLGPALPEERAEIARHGFIPSISNFQEAAEFDRCASGTLGVNFVIDTGMGRMGAAEIRAVAEFKKISGLSRIQLHSISTHLPVADEDAQFTHAQIKRFRELVRQIRQEAAGPVRAHALLSAGILGFAQEPFDIVRAGLMLYGISPLPHLQKLLEPVMSLKTRVVLVRDMPKGSSISYGRAFVAPRPMRVATLSVGYADGFPRGLSGRAASVLIGGKRCALLGRVTMDLVMVDVSEVNDIQAGDEAVLIGRQGSEQILASETAERARTIPWEIFTGIGSRVRRVYL